MIVCVSSTSYDVYRCARHQQNRRTPHTTVDESSTKSVFAEREPEIFLHLFTDRITSRYHLPQERNKHKKTKYSILVSIESFVEWYSMYSRSRASTLNNGRIRSFHFRFNPLRSASISTLLFRWIYSSYTLHATAIVIGSKRLMLFLFPLWTISRWHVAHIKHVYTRSSYYIRNNIRIHKPYERRYFHFYRARRVHPCVVYVCVRSRARPCMCGIRCTCVSSLAGRQAGWTGWVESRACMRVCNETASLPSYRHM